MAFQINYGGDDTFVLAETLRLVSEQPSDWVIRVEHNEDGMVAGASSDGTIASFDGSTLVLAETDDDGQHTGIRRVVELSDITALDIY